MALQAGRIDVEGRAARRDATQVTADALPFLTSTPAGRRFLRASAPRALARGAPPALCPATGVAGGAPSLDRAVGRALSDCLAALPPRARAAGCGCEVLVFDDTLAVRPDDLIYATGTSARLRVPAEGIDALLVAEAGRDGALLIRGANRAVAVLDRGPSRRAVTVRFAGSSRVYEGEAEPIGFRRGRLAERVYAEAEDGSRLSLLIGFGPDELAREAGAGLAWRPPAAG